jgi:phosphatidylserine/phosphatidylglycerophosphate/cardiolipin synthase-like enzyme
MPIDALIQKYCATTNAPMPAPGETVPTQNTAAAMGNHRSYTFINGDGYFKAIEQEINQLLADSALPEAQRPRNRFFYLSAWWLGLASHNGTIRVDNSWNMRQVTGVDGATGEPIFSETIDMPDFQLPVSGLLLSTQLVTLAKAGVNVRVMAWVSPFIAKQEVAEGSGLAQVNFHTLLSVDALRKQMPSPDSVVVNLLAHSLGAAHCKLVICGDATRMRAYTSGLDPVENRYNPPGPGGGWHDVGVRVEGSAAGAIHDFYRSMWNEQLTRPVETINLNGSDIASHNSAWAPLIAREPIALAANTGQQYVQVLRTVPQMNFNESGPRRRGQLLLPNYSAAVQIAVGTYVNLTGFRRPRFSFAPKGLFEFKVALRQAISQAEEYIFIADQSLYALEVMDWIHERVLRRPNLKVILFYGADPADPPSNFLAEAINKHLAPGLPLSGAKQLDNITFRQWDNNAVHCKVTIIDDTWCAIGSANCMRRSLYTDLELSVGILQEPIALAQLPTTPAQEANPTAFGKQEASFVQRFRRYLWAHYCAVPNNPPTITNAEKKKLTELLDLRKALAIWDLRWGQGQHAAGVTLRSEISKLALTPFPSNPENPFRQIQYDRQDADSRQPF